MEILLNAVEVLLKFLSFSLPYTLGWLIVWLIEEIKKEQAQQRKSPQTPRPKPQRQPPAPVVDRSTHMRLLNMVGGDSDTCYRLIRYTRTRHPHLTEQECWERAIEDLIRDRR